MSIFGSKTPEEKNAESIKRVPSELIDENLRQALIEAARAGRDAYAYQSGRGKNWNLWRDGERVWLNDPEGGDAA